MCISIIMPKYNTENLQRSAINIVEAVQVACRKRW